LLRNSKGHVYFLTLFSSNIKLKYPLKRTILQFKLFRNGGRFSVLLHTIFEDLILLFRLVVSMGYYGLSLNTGNLSGDFYINFLLSGLAEFPAYTLCLLLLDRIGRRKLHVSCMILGGVACICTRFTMLYAGEGRAI
jgi:hypothetical protein